MIGSVTDIYMIIKMYKDYKIPNKNEPSHVGHTILFGKENGQYVFIDPQNRLRLPLVAENLRVSGYIAGILKSYFEHMQYIDISFGVNDVANIPSMTSSVEQSLRNQEAIIIPRDPDIAYGGKKRCRKNKKNKTCKKGRKSKQSKKCRRRRRQSRKYVGGSVEEILNNDEFDDFEKFMLYTDEQNNIPTVLNTTNI